MHFNKELKNISEKEESKNKSRGYATTKASVQISKILEKRKQDPFLTL
jgi:hypothetical protein